MNISEEAIEAAARAAAIHDEHDGCFERIDEWEAQPDWQKEAHPDEYPAHDYEDAEYWRAHIRAALEAAAPLLMAQALREMAETFDTLDTDPIKSWHPHDVAELLRWRASDITT